MTVQGCDSLNKHVFFKKTCFLLNKKSQNSSYVLKNDFYCSGNKGGLYPILPRFNFT